MRRAAIGTFVVAAAVTASCAIISVDDYVGNGDAPAEDGGATDASLDGGDASASEEAAAPTQPSVIDTRATPWATGRAQQTHLLYVKEKGRWVFFAFDPATTNRLTTRLSNDFVTWTDGTPLTLPTTHTSDGRNLAVAAVPSSTNVFHVSLSLGNDEAHNHHHVRATLGTSMVFDTVQKLGDAAQQQEGIDPDGPAVVVNGAGRVFDIAGWATPPPDGFGSANMIPWWSTGIDDGTTWNGAFAAPFQLETVKLACNARALVGTPQGALAIWESGDEEPKPKGLHHASFLGEKWSAVGDVGFELTAFDANDWGVATIGTTTHVVRWTADGFSHRVFADGAPGPGQGMATGRHAEGGGVVLLADGAILRAYTVDPDGAVLVSSLDKNWSDWTELLPKKASRTGLTGFASDAAAALAWVEGSPGNLSVVGYRLR